MIDLTPEVLTLEERLKSQEENGMDISYIIRVCSPHDIRVLEEYTKMNNIEYNFLLVLFYFGDPYENQIEKILLIMKDGDKREISSEEIYVKDGVLYENELIPIAKRLIREQRSKELV